MTLPADRLAAWNRWYGPARLGVFYHWGQRTGGGDSSSHSWGGVPFKHPTMADFERAAGEPDAVARNMVALARRLGARYIIYTVFHSCNRFAVNYPTQLDGFVVKTTRDYLGALADECHRQNLHLLLYVPESGGEQHVFSHGGPWLRQPYIGHAEFIPLLHGLVDELAARHGDEIAGFWLDGYYRAGGEVFANHVHARLPGSIVVYNNDTALSRPGVDVAAIECTTTPCDPPYCRPSGLVKPHADWGVLPPKSDFVEDIPTCNNWFHTDADSAKLAASPYVTDPTFLVKQMVSSLGQRRRWNFALGIGPREDGTAPEIFAPMIANTGAFLAWAGEAIYNTLGGEGSTIAPGWWSHGAFGSVTVSLEDPTTYYLHITTPPTGDQLKVQTSFQDVVSVADLRTGKPVAFRNRGCLELAGLDCSDTTRYGATVLKTRLCT